MPKAKIRNHFIQAFFLTLSILLTWIWVENPTFTNLNLVLILGLFFLYVVAKIVLARKNSFANTFLNIIIFTVALLVIIANTGGLGSSFFFLIYFLLFAVALMFDPLITITLTLALSLFFTNTLNSLDAALNLTSLLFFSALSIYFGKQYLRLLQSQNKIKILAKQGKKITKSIENEETSALLFLTLDFKNGLLQIIHESSELLSDIGRLSLLHKEKVQKINSAAKELLKSGQKLQEKIDKETD